MQHLAVIMDGNRRWAKKKKFSSFKGHKKGKDAAHLAVEFCIKNNIKYLSLYTFSLENFNRSKQEQEEVFSILLEGIGKELDEFVEQKVRVCFIGDRQKFPQHLIPAIEKAEKITQRFKRLQVNILFCYGGRQELVNAVRNIARHVKDGDLCVEDIDAKILEGELWTADVPHPDLIVRTSGVSRLSNFFLYQAAYSELQFIDCYWPDITEAHLKKCVEDYQATRKNIGH